MQQLIFVLLISRKFSGEFFSKFNLPETFVNYFPGYLVSKHLSGKNKVKSKLSIFGSSPFLFNVRTIPDMFSNVGALTEGGAP